MVEAPKVPNIKVASPMAATNKELQQLNETMAKALEQLTRIQGLLVKIEMHTKPRPNLGGRSSYS